jgi:hypothetical protein
MSEEVQDRTMLSRKKTYPSVTKYLHRCAVFALICAASWSLSAYSFPVAHPSDRQFVGTWKAIHDGKTIIVLQLQSTNAGLSGTIRLAGFQLDLEGDGSVLVVTDERLDSPIGLRNIKVEGKILSFDFVDHDGDNDKFQMEVTAGGSAKLMWIDLPKGMKAQPIVVTRQPDEAPKGASSALR